MEPPALSRSACSADPGLMRPVFSQLEEVAPKLVLVL